MKCKLNVFESNYVDCIAVNDENKDDCLTIRESAGNFKFRNKTVFLKKKRVIDFEFLYWKLYDACLKYNHGLSQNLCLREFHEIEADYRSESKRIYNDFLNRNASYKLMLLGCRVFFDQLKWEWGMDHQTLHNFLCSRSWSTRERSDCNLFVQNRFLDRLFDVMYDGSVAHSVSMRDFERLLDSDELKKKFFGKGKVYFDMYFALQFDMSCSIDELRGNIANCVAFNSVYVSLVWGFCFDISCSIEDKESLEFALWQHCTHLYNGELVLNEYKCGPGQGECRIFECGVLEAIDKKMFQLFEFANTHNFHDSFVNGYILTQIRLHTVGLRYEKSSFYNLCLYIVYIKKFLSEVVSQITIMMNTVHVERTLRFRVRRFYRNLNLIDLMKATGSFRRLASQWTAGTSLDQQCHSHIASLVNEERFVWSSAIIPFFIEFLLLSMHEETVLENLIVPSNAESKCRFKFLFECL